MGTSLGQSSRAAFMEYVAWRELGLGPDEAYARVGLHGGDDGLSHYMDPAHYNTVVSNMGMKLKVQVVEMGKGDVEFLGRIYSPQVFFGEPDSMCDPVRTLSQFPYSNSDADRDTVARTKAFAASLNDGNTPFVGPLAKKILDSLDATGKLDVTAMSWNASRVLDEGTGYPNKFGDWMLDACKARGINGTLEWDEYINGDGDWSKPPKLVVADDVKPSVRALVGDLMHNNEKPDPVIVEMPADPPLPPPPSQGKEKEKFVRPKKVAKPCFAFQAGSCTRKKCQFVHVPKQEAATADHKALRTKPKAGPAVASGRH